MAGHDLFRLATGVGSRATRTGRAGQQNMFTLAALATFAVYLLPLIIALARRVRPVPRAGDRPFATDGCVNSLDHIELGLRDQPHARRGTHSALTCVNMASWWTVTARPVAGASRSST